VERGAGDVVLPDETEHVRVVGLDEERVTSQPDRFKGECVGRPVFVLGCGPSLLDWHPDELAELGAATVGLNTCYMGAHPDNPDSDHPGFREVDYYGYVSEVHTDAVMEGRVKVRRCVFLPQDYEIRYRHSSSTYDGEWCALRRFGGSTPTGFRYDLRRGFSANFAGYIGVQVAAHVCAHPRDLGRIVLVGFDGRSGEGHHHDQDPRNLPRFAPRVSREGMVRWYGGVREWVDQARLAEVVVYGKDSAIEQLPRMDKQEVLEWLERRRSESGSTDGTTPSERPSSTSERASSKSSKGGKRGRSSRSSKTGGRSRDSRGGKS
jgi:hypothetical protein